MGWGTKVVYLSSKNKAILETLIRGINKVLCQRVNFYWIPFVPQNKQFIVDGEFCF